MAFENVFRGIDWDAQNRGARQDQALLMRSIGQGMAAYERGQDRDMRNRQLDMQQKKLDYDMNKQADFNLKQTAEQGLLAMAQGAKLGQLPPDMQAAVKVYDAQRQDYVTDRFGNVVPQPSISGSLTGVRGQGIIPEVSASSIPQGKMNNALGMQPIDASAVGGLPSDIRQNFPQTPQQTQKEIIIPQMNLMGAQAQSPLGQEIVLRGQAELQKKAAEMQIEEQFRARKGQEEIEKFKPKAQKALTDTFASVKNLNTTIDKAIEQISPYSAGLGAWSKFIPATPAKNLESTLNTIQADAAFGKLQQMRENSPSGGALGSVSERELALLGSAQAALDQEQSAEQLAENLSNYRDIRNSAFNNVLAAYEEDYGEAPRAIKNMLKTDTQKKRDRLAVDMGLMPAPQMQGFEGWTIEKVQ